jgi:ribonuclease HI
MKHVFVYTDGGAINNPGPGGFGVVLLYKGHRRELSCGYRLTTNNRMELLACIVGLSALKEPCKVTLYSDSQYVVNGIEKGWAKRWQKKGWKRNKKKLAENVDLWSRLLELCEKHQVRFVWVKGHAENQENNRCDQLAGEAARSPSLMVDENYEKGATTVSQKDLLQFEQ